MTAPVRLDNLPPAGRRICAALIEAERAARSSAPPVVPPAHNPEAAEVFAFASPSSPDGPRRDAPGASSGPRAAV
jgi:hypothetical protein